MVTSDRKEIPKQFCNFPFVHHAKQHWPIRNTHTGVATCDCLNTRVTIHPGQDRCALTGPAEAHSPCRGDSLQTRSVMSRHESGCSGGEGTDQEARESFLEWWKPWVGLWGVGVCTCQWYTTHLQSYIARDEGTPWLQARVYGDAVDSGVAVHVWGWGTQELCTSCPMVLWA